MNNEQLVTAQKSELGIDLDKWQMVMSTDRFLVGLATDQADDMGLLANSLASLKCLLYLNKVYCLS